MDTKIYIKENILNVNVINLSKYMYLYEIEILIDFKFLKKRGNAYIIVSILLLSNI